MRGQPGPCLVPGNAPAARRLARARKPPPIILWTIGIITCLFFMGSAALIAVGYLNPYGTVGLSILGVGAVVYFGGIIFLVLSCLWVERKYPGMQPLSFKILSRKPQRPIPTAFVNPNVSGQIAQTVPPYRIHNETPSNETSSDIEAITENIPSGPSDLTQNNNDKQNGNDLPEEVSSLDHDNPSTTQQSLQDEGSEDIIKDHKPEDITTTETGNQDASTITSEKDTIEYKSNAQNDNKTKNTTDQNENISQNNQKENHLAKTSNAQNRGKAQQKTHQLELPVEDYPISENSTSATSNNKESGPKTQGTQPKDITQQSRKSQEINLSNTAAVPSISTSQEERTTMHPQKDTHKDDVPSLSSSREQQSTQKQSLPVQQTQQNTLRTVATETDRLFKRDQNAKDISQRDNLQKQPAVRVRKPIKEPQSQDIQDTSQEKTMGITLTDNALLNEGRKPILHIKKDTVLQSPKLDNKSEVLTKTSGNERKRVQFQEYHVQSVQNIVKENPKVSSGDDGKDALPYRNDGRHHKHQHKSLTNDVSASTQHFSQKLDLQGGLPGFTKKMETPQKPKKVQSPERTKNDSSDRARIPDSPAGASKMKSPERARKPESPARTSKMESPERARKPESPARASKMESPERARKPESPARASKMESPERARKPESPARANKMESPERVRKPESPGRARKQESPERARKPESPERRRQLRTDHKLSHSPPNTRKMASSSSPTRHHQNISPKAQRNKDNSIVMINLSSSKEELYRRRNYHSSQSSQSSDLPSSTSSSPPRHHNRSPDLSPKHQFHASENADFYSSIRKEKRPDKHSQQSSPSSYSSDAPSSTSSSPQSHCQKDAEISNKAQRQNDKQTVNSGFPSNTKKDDLNKRLSQQSSQSNEVTFSPPMSPTKRLQHKLERADLTNFSRSPHTTDPSIQTSGSKTEYRQQTKHQHQDKPRTSSHSREFSPTAARTSPISNKRFPANPREDQT
ncbi:uncharacterized protein [Aquarana catesbeiana]|uniref:uncharacterized protein n=1 Tax=Aquarana catesbeiana TaxID=8400 RepID=UPI003CC9F99C